MNTVGVESPLSPSPTLDKSRTETLALQVLKNLVRQGDLPLGPKSFREACRNSAVQSGISQEIIEEFAIRVLIPALLENFNLKVIRPSQKSKMEEAFQRGLVLSGWKAEPVPSDGEIAIQILACSICTIPFPYESDELRSVYYGLINSGYATAKECDELSNKHLIPCRRKQRDALTAINTNN